MFPWGKDKGKRQGIWDQHEHAAVFKMRLCIAQDLLYSTGNSSQLCGRLDGRRVWRRMDTCMCMAESLCCPLATITTLLLGYTPVQNKKLKKKKSLCF